MIITSRQNPRVKSLIDLRRRRTRDEQKVMVVEGYPELQTAIAGGAKVRELYFCPELMGDASQHQLLEQMQSQQVEATELNRDVFEKVAYRESPDGWLAVCDLIPTDLAHIKVTEKSLLLVAESVEKPGNLGAMLRTANAAGVDAVISAEAITDWGNPNIVRASKGAIFATPVADAGNQELYDWLKKNNIAIVATTPDTDQVYTQADLTGPIAIFVGAEKPGLTDFWLNKADIKVQIPMVGTVDSLNVATSAALLVYEAIRQRQK